MYFPVHKPDALLNTRLSQPFPLHSSFNLKTPALVVNDQLLILETAPRYSSFAECNSCDKACTSFAISKVSPQRITKEAR
jgi:hypothetical protein